MQVTVVINPKAGYVNVSMMKNQIQNALFRCDLHFWVSDGIDELKRFLLEQLNQNTEAIVICGGDGTFNVCIQPLLAWSEKTNKELPPICVVGSGTANDLASEIGANRRIDKAVRDIFEGKIKKVDVIKISSGGVDKYMVTNGGFGIPAATAEKANIWRQSLSQIAEKNNGNSIKKALCRTAQSFLTLARTQIYNIALLDTLRAAKKEDFDMTITTSCGKNIETRASFIIVSNQSVIGGKFVSAPYTINDDGTFDLLLLESDHLKGMLKSLLNTRRGQEPEFDYRRFELKSFELKSANPIKFFGDGEILHTNLTQCRVECMPQRLPVLMSGGGR